MKIAVLYGGTSDEREVSLMSGRAIFDSLKKRSYDVELIDTKYDFYDKLAKGNFDLAFIALHGKNGEDGSIQGFLQTLNIPYTGSGVLSSSICMNKVITKQIAISNKIKTPKYSVIKNEITNLNIDFPMLAKPVSGGSSVNTKILKSQSELNDYLKDNKDKILLEEYIKGKELTVGILELTKPVALTPLEIRPKNEFYDYESKYTKGLTDFILPPELSKDKIDEVKDISLKLFSLLKCQGFARADFIFDGEDFYFLEMNSIPGFTVTSDIPIAARFDGINFDELVEVILKSAFKQKFV